MPDLSELDGTTFAEQLHTNFHVKGGDATFISLQLTEVKESPTPPDIELFSLYFVGPGSPRLPQRTYSVKHEKMGSFDLFLTAIAGDAKETTYEAVFHRLRRKQA